MALVYFSGELQQLVGEGYTRADGTIFKDIVQELAGRYENLDEAMLMDMAIAIDGEIIHTPLLETVGADCELHFLHRISGG